MVGKKIKLKKSCSFPAEVASTQAALNFFENLMLLWHVNEKVVNEYRLVVEEVYLKLIENAPENSTIKIEGIRSLSRVTLKMSCPGSPVNLIEETNQDLGSQILEQYQDHFKQSYSNGTNTITFFTSYMHYIQTGNLIAFVLSALTALLISCFCNDSVQILLTDGLCYPLCEIYTSYLEILAVPVVFFSIIVIIVRLHLEFEKRQNMVHIFIEYLFSSIVAILISFIFIQLVAHTMNPSLIKSISSAVSFSYGTESELQMFMEEFKFNGMGSDFVLGTPVQVIVLAMLVGFAISSSFGSNGIWLRKASYALSNLFSRILSILYSVIPLFLYFAFLSLWLYNGLKLILYINLIVVLFAVPLIILMIIYSLQLGISGISPIRFIREYKSILKENIRIASNIDALQYNNRVLSHKLSMPASRRKGILAIGAIANMDGNCLLISAFTFIMCLIFDVKVTPQLVINIFLIILVISVGAPNEPGSFLISLVFIINYLGIRYDYCDFLIATECVLGVIYSSINCIGDIVFIVVDDQRLKRLSKK